MNREIRKRHKDFNKDKFLTEVDRAVKFMLDQYHSTVSTHGDKITVSENKQAKQAILWIRHLRKVYIDEHYPELVEHVLYATKS